MVSSIFLDYALRRCMSESERKYTTLLQDDESRKSGQHLGVKARA
jgi:hypothetical protein